MRTVRDAPDASAPRAQHQPAARARRLQRRLAARWPAPGADTTVKPRGIRSQISTPWAVPPPLRAVAVSTNVTVPPARTIRRLARLRSVTPGPERAMTPATATRAGGAVGPGGTVGTVGAVGIVGVALIAVTPLRNGPGARARTVTTTVAEAPGASAPRSQRSGTPAEHVPWLGTAETTWRLPSGVSVMTTESAGPGPRLCAVTV